MKPFESFASLDAFGSAKSAGRGWRIVVDELIVSTHIGLHAHENASAQPVAIDASLHYRGEPSESGARDLIDYESWCERVTRYLEGKPHTRLLESLAVELAALSFDEWPALDAITLLLYKPKIRQGTRRVGVELDWHRTDFDAWRTRVALCAGETV